LRIWLSTTDMNACMHVVRRVCRGQYQDNGLEKWQDIHTNYRVPILVCRGGIMPTLWFQTPSSSYTIRAIKLCSPRTCCAITGPAPLGRASTDPARTIAWDARSGRTQAFPKKHTVWDAKVLYTSCSTTTSLKVNILPPQQRVSTNRILNALQSR
jgi:hypothetical protein